MLFHNYILSANVLIGITKIYFTAIFFTAVYIYLHIFCNYTFVMIEFSTFKIYLISVDSHK